MNIARDDQRTKTGMAPMDHVSNAAVARTANRNTYVNRYNNGTRNTNDEVSCKCCKKRNHTTNQCCHLSKPLCDNCHRFGHMTKDCYWNNKRKQALEDNRSDTHVYKKNKSNHAAETNEVSAICIEEIKDVEMKPLHKETDYGL